MITDVEHDLINQMLVGDDEHSADAREALVNAGFEVEVHNEGWCNEPTCYQLHRADAPHLFWWAQVDWLGQAVVW